MDRSRRPTRKDLTFGDYPLELSQQTAGLDRNFTCDCACKAYCNVAASRGSSCNAGDAGAYTVTVAPTCDLVYENTFQGSTLVVAEPQVGCVTSYPSLEKAKSSYTARVCSPPVEARQEKCQPGDNVNDTRTCNSSGGCQVNAGATCTGQLQYKLNQVGACDVDGGITVAAPSCTSIDAGTDAGLYLRVAARSVTTSVNGTCSVTGGDAGTPSGKLDTTGATTICCAP
jgi:hypothetical protein